jgi:hypothetical protein
VTSPIDQNLGIQNLLFRSNLTEWSSLPPWANFFLSLGQFLEVQPRTSERTVMGAALPVRDFAASLAATGVVVTHLKNSLESDLEYYFEELSKLPLGTGVMVSRSNKEHGTRQYPGVLAGLDEASLNPLDKSAPKVKLIRIQVSRSTMRESKAGGRVFMVDAKRADTIRVLDPDETITRQELPATPSGSSIRRVSDFVRKTIGAGVVHNVSKSKVVCLIVGSPGTLNREINELTYGVSEVSEGLSEGTLGELLRVRRFSGARRQFHSDIFTAASKWPPRKSTLGVPNVVIFDGAAGFMKWRDSFPESHLLVVLDQTDALFTEAVHRLNYEYSCRIENEVLPKSFPVPQPGMELTLFREQIT